MHEHGLSDWLPQAAPDVSNVEVGIFRCVQGGENRCTVESLCECGKCCTNGDLWESPLSLEPECAECGRKALLVEIVGVFDYSMALEARAS